MQPSDMTVLSDWNLSRCLFSWTGCLCRSTDLPMNYQKKNEQNNEHCFDQWQVLVNWNPQKLSFHMTTKICCWWLVTVQNLQSIKAFWTLEHSQYLMSGCTFSSSKPVTAYSDCFQTSCHCQQQMPLLGNALCLCLPVWLVQAVNRAA